MFGGERIGESCRLGDTDLVQRGVAQSAQPSLGVERRTPMPGQMAFKLSEVCAVPNHISPMRHI